MALNEDVVQSVTNANFKTIADQPSLDANNLRALQAMAFQNAIAHQQAMNTLLVAATGKITELIATVDVAEAAGLTPVAQQASKTAGNTPPVTP